MIHIIQPETLMRWHQELFSVYWWWKSKSKKGNSKISPETIDLIQWYIFVVMELKTRRIVHRGVTKYPTDEWPAALIDQQKTMSKHILLFVNDAFH